MIAIDQIRTVDKKRIIKILGKLNKVEIKLTKEVIKETLFIFDSYTHHRPSFYIILPIVQEIHVYGSQEILF
jgi:hypothetical protein